MKRQSATNRFFKSAIRQRKKSRKTIEGLRSLNLTASIVLGGLLAASVLIPLLASLLR